MSNKESPNFSQNVLNWAEVGAQIAEDMGRGILGFIPDGLNVIYDEGLKALPFIGSIFKQHWVEEIIKFLTGITIGRGLSADLAYYVFRPIGFFFGTLLGTRGIKGQQRLPKYAGQVKTFLYKLSGQTVLGILIGLGVLFLLMSFHPYLQTLKITYREILLAIAIGGGVGLISKAVMLVAIHTVQAANAASSRMHTQRAQKLCTFLKTRAQKKAAEIVKQHAEDIILQMNGEQCYHYLEGFFNDNMQRLMEWPNKKIARHLNYVTDRAVHGDMESLKKLYRLYPRKGQDPIDHLIHRILNEREQNKIKDEADSLFDKWYYTTNIRLSL